MIFEIKVIKFKYTYCFFKPVEAIHRWVSTSLTKGLRLLILSYPSGIISQSSTQVYKEDCDVLRKTQSSTQVYKEDCDVLRKTQSTNLVYKEDCDVLRKTSLLLLNRNRKRPDN